MHTMVRITAFVILVALGPGRIGADDSTGAAGEPEEPTGPRPTQLHWFIPDGMRADPHLFDIYRWAQEGKLPNIRKMMEQGAYGFAIPTFPSHTPTNFANLLTGTYPEVHGVADGPMRLVGHPLARPSLGGFRSVARKVPAIWSYLAESPGGVVLLSMPGSTPPELKQNAVTIRGRWGGWGADFASLVFERASREQRRRLGRASRLFFLGHELTRFIEPTASSGHVVDTDSRSAPLHLRLEAYGATIHAAILDTTDDGRTNYDMLEVAAAGSRSPVLLRSGDWTPWMPVMFRWSGQEVASHVRLQLVRLNDDGFFRIRYLVDNLNRYVTSPGDAAEALVRRIGPMVDFVDNFPPQLIYYDEDRQTFLDEAGMSLDWHRKAVGAIYELYGPDVFIHDIYTPNQMLTSRWWLGYLDPASRRYHDVAAKEREILWGEVLDMYRALDEIVGAALDHAGPDTLVVLSSDHGAVPLDRWVRLNNLFARQGWLHYRMDEQTGEPAIDWERTRVVYLKMDNIYIHPEGLDGDWTRGFGAAYEKLRGEVIAALGELTDPERKDEARPVCGIVRWEDVEAFLDLPTDRVGDLIVANCVGYGWNEEITGDGAVFDTPLKTGYKQAILAEKSTGMWVPFVITGPGVKKNHRIDRPIAMVDQFPTIMRLLGRDIPDHVQGKVIDEILE